MNGAKGKPADFISRLKVEMRQDKKKTTVLVILLMVAGIVGGRLVVTRGPTDAASAIGSAGAAKRLISDTGEDTRAGLGRKSERQTRQVDFASTDRTINRDLFRPDTKYFPSADQTARHPVASRPDQARQLAEAKQPEHLRRMEHVKSIRTQAESLCLTSTMLGRSPTALINGQVLRAGEVINGFHLKSIAPDYCIVAAEGVDVKLKMRK
ncbi:MAG: hypothetical protein K8R91_03285 [Phycisphaerae bacterium]|nr:hypothetical protein [Phycisphaerae bacterium]